MKKYDTEEKRTAARKAAAQKYRASAKGKAYIKAYNQTPKYRAYISEYRQSAEYKALRKRCRELPETKIKDLYTSAGRRANKYNLPFTITADMVDALFWACEGICSVTGDRFDLSLRDDVQSNPCSPSLDQIVPGVGYTPDNIQIVVHWYNRFKNDLTDNEALEILRVKRGWLNNYD